MKRFKNALLMILTISLLFSSPTNTFAAVSSKSSTPPPPTLTYSPTISTNSIVSVNINYPKSVKNKQYKLGTNGIWSTYSGTIVLNENAIVYARYQNSKNVWSGIGSISVSNIDKVAPALPTFSEVNSDGNVIVTIQFSTDSNIKQYKINDGVWINYTQPIITEPNTTLYASAADLAGNRTNTTGFTTMNIVNDPIAETSKMVMGYAVKYSSTDKSSYNSIVANTTAINQIATATFSIDGLGNITGTPPEDQLAYAQSNNISTKLMISNNFDSTIAKTLLQSPDNRKRLENNILNIITTYHYNGVDIDIENIPAVCRDDFTSFMRETYELLKPKGYDVSVAVQAKTYDSSTATWNYAFDYQALAQYADYLMIMAYDEHYPGGTPGAIASIGWVTNVVNYALTVVPKEKIVLGLAAYGYDWSGSTTKAYGINGSLNLANQYGATIYFDTVTKSKYFNYQVNGVSHTVWFEDAETLSYKLDLVLNKDIKGIGIWRLGLENSDYWNMIRLKLNK